MPRDGLGDDIRVSIWLYDILLVNLHHHIQRDGLIFQKICTPDILIAPLRCFLHSTKILTWQAKHIVKNFNENTHKGKKIIAKMHCSQLLFHIFKIHFRVMHNFSLLFALWKRQGWLNLQWYYLKHSFCSAFFWLLALFVSSVLWIAVVPLKSYLVFGVTFSVLFQELFRLAFWKILK